MDKGLTFDDAVKVLERYGRVSWSDDSNAVSAQCVAHDDGRPSLSVKRGEDGRAVVHCFAGCDWRDVLDRLKALAAPGVKISSRQQQEIRARGKPKEIKTRTEYEIRDVNGVLQAVRVRLDYSDGTKDVFWKDGLMGRRAASLPLFGSEVLKNIPLDVPIIVCEGEKDTVARWGKGEVAVGTVTGSGAIPDDDVLRVLVGRPVRLWPDNDASGERHMQRIGERLPYLNRKARGGTQ